jgi:hypothetical protein
MIRRALLAGTAVVAAALPTGPVGGASLIPGETDAMGIKFNYDTDVTKQMEVITSGVIVDSDPFASLVYTSPSPKLCQQSDLVWRYGNHNLVLQSQTFDNAAWTGPATVGANSIAAPDGTTTADTITETAGASCVFYSSATTVVAGGVYKVSCWLKRNNFDWIRLIAADDTAGTNYVRTWFNLNTGAVGTSSVNGWSSGGTATIADAGNGWYLCTIYVIPTTTTLYHHMRSSAGDNNVNRVNVGGGDGIGGAWYAWGAQVKRDPSQDTGGYTAATGYIATTTAAKYGLPYEWLAGVAQGIKPESARTNLVLRSQELGSAQWNSSLNVSISSNATTAPDGTTTADKVVENGVNGNHILYQQLTTVSGSTYTFSAFLKAAQRTTVSLEMSDGAISNGAFGQTFNLSTGALSGAAYTWGTGATIVGSSIQDAGNGWYRCTITGTISGTSTAVYLSMGNYAGDGSSGMYMWGTQCELGSYATSPIHTIAATVARAIDTITLATSAYPHSDSVGTLIACWKNGPYTASLGTYRHIMHLSDGTSNERHVGYIDTLSANIKWSIIDGGVDQTANGTVGTAVASTIQKMALAYTLNDSAVCVDGGVVTTDAACTMPTVTSLKFGVDAAGTALPLDGYLREISYFKRRMTNGEIAEYSDPNVTIGTYEDETWSFLARTATAQVAARKTVYNTLVAALKSAGVWTKLDGLYCFDAATTTTALLNLKSSSFPATAVNSPAFTADQGYSLTGASSHAISTTFNPSSSGGSWAQNSACMFAWCNTALPTTPDGGPAIMTGNISVGGNNDSRLYVRAYGDFNFGQINSDGVIADAAASGAVDARGLHLVNRSAATVQEHRHNLATNTNAAASRARVNNTVGWGYIQGNERFTGVILGGGFGGSLTDTEQLALYSALRAYHVSVAGISVP